MENNNEGKKGNVRIKGRIVIPGILSDMKVGEKKFLARDAIIAYMGPLTNNTNLRNGVIPAFLFTNGPVTRHPKPTYGCVIPVHRIGPGIDEFEINISDLEQPEVIKLKISEIDEYKKMKNVIQCEIPSIFDEDDEDKQIGFKSQSHRS